MESLQFVYHVTTKKAYKKIQKEGLLPKIGKLSKEYGEKDKKIYFFINEDEANNALENWLGEALEDFYGEDVECVLLKVNLSSHKIKPIIDTNGLLFFEQSISVPVLPELIEFVKEC